MPPQAQNVKPAATESVIKLIKEGFYPSVFHAVFEGDPIEIGESLLPCVVVEKIAGEVTVAGTGMDRITEQIRIKVVLNKKDDFGASNTEDLTERKLRQYIEAQDADDGYYAANTLLWILRTNYTLLGLATKQDITISYDADLRPNDVITSEAHVTIVVSRIVQVPDRR